MKVSKVKILDTARLLFNQKGLAAVTARLISAELEISPGSFSYHFPDKSRLVVELYRSLVDEMNSCLLLLKTDEISIKPFLNTFQKCAYVQFKYKFFFLNLSEVLINYPVIKQMHKRAVIRERLLAKQLFQHYLASGIIKKDTTMPDLKLILKQSQILFAYWIADAELGKFKSEARAIWYYTEVCCATIKPFLNNKWKKEYLTYFKKSR